ncbi:MAG: ABC transporter permease [Deltaproteobacteria bacterium]|nr:ABC transporter permease [Deltaproteobacteria bacterium]
MKFIIRLGFKNIFRNKRRSLLTISAIFFATMLIVFFKAWIAGMFDNMIKNVIMFETGHVKVSNTKFLEKEKLMPLEYYVDDAQGHIDEIEKINEVDYVTPRIKVPVMLNINDKNYNALVFGIDPIKEKRFNTLHQGIVKGEYLDNDNDHILIGKKFAEDFDLKVGDRITLLGRTIYNSISLESFEIAGLFSYGITTLEKKAFFVTVESAQDLTQMGGGATELIVMLHDIEDEGIATAKINQELEEPYIARSWKEQGNYYNMVRVATSIYNVVYLFFLVLAAFVIINTIMISVYEREREIGALTALGMSRKEVLGLFVVEAGTLSLIGSFAGSMFGGLLSFVFSKFGINTLELAGSDIVSEFNLSDTIYLNPSWGMIVFAFIFGAIVTIACAVIPALKATKIDPIKALRSV